MRTPFRNVDASWLRMDDPVNLMVVTGVLVLDAPVPVARLRALVEKRLLHFRRFTSRVVPPFAGVGAPDWEPDPDFDLDRHLMVARLGTGAGEPALQAFVSRLLSEPLPADRPLWSMHSRRALPGRVGHRRPDPPLHRRRPGAGPRAALDGRRDARAGAGPPAHPVPPSE